MTIGTNKAFIIISTVQDAQPEYATWFFVNLTSVSIGAVIKSDMSAVNVTIMESDYPAGKIAFDVLSRYDLYRTMFARSLPFRSASANVLVSTESV